MSRTFRDGLLAYVLLAGCGRISFDLTSDASTATSDTLTDGRTVDLPPNALTMTFGENTLSDVQGVTTDTFISNETNEATLNYGGTDELRSEQDVSERILLRFDVSAIAPTPTVIEATVTVEVTQTHPSAVWEIHDVLQAWTEGTLDGFPGQTNFLQRDLGIAWTNAGCGEPTSAGPTFTTVPNIPLGTFTFSIDPAVVQLWISTPAQNNGMVLYNTFGESVRFASSEGGTPAGGRPELRVTYVP